MSDSNSIILGYAKIWTAPVGSAFPAATIGFGTAWGGSWLYLGDTLEPLTLGGDREEFKVEIQQATAPVKTIITKDEKNFSTVMAEHNILLLNQLLLGTATDTAPGSGTPGYYTLDFGGKTIPNVLAVGFEALFQTEAGVQPPIRWMFYRGSIIQNGDIAYDKNGVAGIPVMINTYADTSQATNKQLGRLQIIYSVGT